MAHLRLGDFAFDMSLPDDFGLDEFGLFADDGDPVIDLFSSTLILARDPLTGSTLRVTGLFYENPVGDERSIVTGIEARTAVAQGDRLILAFENILVDFDILFPEGDDPDDDYPLANLLNGNDTVEGGAVGSTLAGYAGNDLLLGGAGNDRLLFGPGDDTLLGGGGVDTVVSGAPVIEFSVAVVEVGILLAHLPGALGTELVGWDVERAIFPGIAFALDLDGNAGDALALLYAGFDTLPPPQDLGRWIAALDAGGTMTSVGSQMIDYYTQGQGISNADLVTLLYTNIVGQPPGEAELAQFVGMIEGGMTQGELFAFAADSPLNRAQYADLVGIAIEYLPWGG